MIWVVWDEDRLVAVYNNEAAAQLHQGDLPQGWISAHEDLSAIFEADEIKSNYQAEAGR